MTPRKKYHLFNVDAIDLALWDRCIEQSPQPRINVLSWYLNLTNPGWKGLIVGEYDAVMPFTIKNRWLNWLINPSFSQQLGLFASRKIDFQDLLEVNGFIEAQNFIHYNFNTSNHFAAKFQSCQLRPNYILPLNQDYDQLVKKYNSNTRRNILSAENNCFELRPISGLELIRLKKDYPAPGVDLSYYQKLPNLISEIESRQLGYGMGVFVNERFIAGAFITDFHNRLTYLLSASNEEGKKKRAMFFLIDQIIRKHAETSKILDFEGSSIPGVARFFDGFGAEPEYYYAIYQANLKTISGVSLYIYQSCIKLKNILLGNLKINK